MKKKDNFIVMNESLSDIDRIIRLTLLSGMLKNENPLSLVLVSPSGCGKTSLLKRYENLKGVDYIYGFATRGYVKSLIDKNIHHVIIASSYPGATFGKKELSALGEKIGVILGMTPAYFNRYKINLDFSRFLVVSYNYSSDFANKVIGKIMGNSVPFSFGKKFRLGVTKYDIKFSGLDLKSLNIKTMSDFEKTRVLLKAIALEKRLKEVNEECVSDFMKLSDYFRTPDNPKII